VLVDSLGYAFRFEEQRARPYPEHYGNAPNTPCDHVWRDHALTERMNCRIQELKRRACGYRNRERFRNAIYFHPGGLGLYPAAAHATDTNP
jgi:hypothetical protein